MEYLLSTQNPYGSWGDMKTRDIYLRYHPTWTANDGLRDYMQAFSRQMPIDNRPNRAPHRGKPQTVPVVHPTWGSQSWLQPPFRRPLCS